MLFRSDDDVLSNGILRSMIESNNNYQVHPFFNGIDLCNYIEEEEDDISAIITDIEMPRRNGIETAQWIRNYELTKEKPRVPIIALTGHSSEEIFQKCTNSGVDKILCKPISKTDALEALKQLIK